MTASAAFPVGALEQQIIALEAALAVCRADPKPAAVHRFRSSSRRIEALFVLLNEQHGLPAFRGAASKLAREMRKLRRAAGFARDQDVLLKLLRTRLRHTTDEAERASAEKLIAHLLSVRAEAGTEFHGLLGSREGKVARRLEAVREALKPAAKLRLPAHAYLDAAQHHIQREGGVLKRLPSAKPVDLARLSDTRLHDIRKAAKLARYLAEAAPVTLRSAAAAKRFHAVQNAGGHWHDWLELAGAARKVLGKGDAFAVALKETRNRHHASFLRSIETIL